MATVTVTTEKFDEVVQGEGIILIDFWAAWCGPCRQFGPIFERAADKHADLVFGKVDTEAEPELSDRFGIASIPTLMVIRDGVIVFAEPGALPEPALENVIEQARALDMDDVRKRLADQSG